MLKASVWWRTRRGGQRRTAGTLREQARRGYLGWNSFGLDLLLLPVGTTSELLYFASLVVSLVMKSLEGDMVSWLRIVTKINDQISLPLLSIK